jgi:hypothetical protein
MPRLARARAIHAAAIGRGDSPSRCERVGPNAPDTDCVCAFCRTAAHALDLADDEWRDDGDPAEYDGSPDDAD